MIAKRAYLIGDTYTIRGPLKAAGWKWDAEKKAWYMDADWDNEAHVAMRVHALPGVRNRGSYSVELQSLDA